MEFHRLRHLIPERLIVCISKIGAGSGCQGVIIVHPDQFRHQSTRFVSFLKQAVREELSGMNFGNAGVGQAKVVLNINGVDVGEAMLDDLFSVMQRLCIRLQHLICNPEMYNIRFL